MAAADSTYNPFWPLRLSILKTPSIISPAGSPYRPDSQTNAYGRSGNPGKYRVNGSIPKAWGSPKTPGGYE